MQNGLSKKERLCSQKAIEVLVAHGRYLSAGPLRCCFLPHKDDEGENRVMVSVSKRLFKRAVKRNLLKRRIRETYRLSKHIIDGQNVNLMFVYKDKDVADFETISASVSELLRRIVRNTNENTP